jgi:hypothetical protein
MNFGPSSSMELFVKLPFVDFFFFWGGGFVKFSWLVTGTDIYQNLQQNIHYHWYISFYGTFAPT